MLYLDYAATTPMRPEVIEVYTKVATDFYGNPSSLHDSGSRAKSILEASRRSIASCLEASDSSRIYFTGSGSEANWLAIRSLLAALDGPGHIVSTTTEHSSVSRLLDQLATEGYEISCVPVDANGRVSVAEVEAILRPDTVMGIFQFVNSEIGTIQPVAELANLFQERGILFHVDAVQAFGKMAIDVATLGVSSLSISGHKIYGPKGVGAVYVAPDVAWKSVWNGGSQEKGFRQGTEDVPAIASFAAASELRMKEMGAEWERMQELRRQFLDGVLDHFSLEGSEKEGGLPHIVGLRHKAVEGQMIMLECNRRGIGISTGSACQVGMQTPSKTLLAIGRTAEEAKRFVRISFGRTTSEEDVKKLVDVLKAIDR